MDFEFEIISKITNHETIAVGNSIRELPRLRKMYGSSRWRKVKGVAKVKLSDNTIHTAEIHWYEAHAIGKKQFKLKRLLD